MSNKSSNGVDVLTKIKCPNAFIDINIKVHVLVCTLSSVGRRLVNFSEAKVFTSLQTACYECYFCHCKILLVNISWSYNRPQLSSSAICNVVV